MSAPTDTTLADADRLEQGLRKALGAPVVSREIDLTSPAVRKQLGANQSDFGVLFDDMGYTDGATVSASKLLRPRSNRHPRPT